MFYTFITVLKLSIKLKKIQNRTFCFVVVVEPRHEKNGNLGDQGSQKILQIAEDLNKNIK